MKIGDVVTTHPSYRGPRLYCGSGIYTHAICVSVDPFILVSEQGDMLWQKVPMGEVQALCQAHPDIVARCKKRMEQDRKNKML